MQGIDVGTYFFLTINHSGVANGYLFTPHLSFYLFVHELSHLLIILYAKIQIVNIKKKAIKVNKIV